jgi:tRNA(Ile)-lysidine synthase
MPWFDEQFASPLDEFLVGLKAGIEAWPAPRKPPRFLVAFSGGIDSTVLLVGLCRLGLAARLRAVHVDHGLQAQSALWSAHCAGVAEQLGVEYVATQVVVDRSAGIGQEAAAREARYAALEALLAPGEVLLTAHHADDQLETLLLRLFRGSGVRGMRGIIGYGEFGPGFLGRPLLKFTRATIAAQARGFGVAWIEDPTNAETRHDRNFLRRSVLPGVLERWPAAARNASRLAEQMCAAEQILDEVAATDAAGLATPWRIPRSTLAALASERQSNLLRYLVRRASLPIPSAKKLDEVRAAILDARPGTHPLVRWPGAEARVYREALYLLAPLPPPSPSGTVWPIGANASWRGPEGEVALERAEIGLPESWLDASLTVRFRVGHERFQPHGHGHRQTLKNWLRAKHVVPWMRDRVPLVYRADELVAIGDLWCAPGGASARADEPRWCVVWRDHPPIL